MTDVTELHKKLDELEAKGANWQRIMTAHALVGAGVVDKIECAMPRCIYDTREFNPHVRSLGLSIDHILPISKGGSHYPINLRLAHLGCNSAAVSFDDSVSHRRSIAAGRTRRIERYRRRNAEQVPIERNDIWLKRWMNETADWLWLDSTFKLQKHVYHVNYDTLIGNEMARYVMMNATALLTEVSEFLQEVQWKPWANEPGKMNRDEAVEELVDVGHFLANLLVALGVSDVEWEVRYREKQVKNAERQKTPGGYTGEKCHKCHRELDRDGALIARDGIGVGGRTFLCCAYCDTPIREATKFPVNDDSCA